MNGASTAPKSTSREPFASPSSGRADPAASTEGAYVASPASIPADPCVSVKSPPLAEMNPGAWSDTNPADDATARYDDA